MKKTKVKSLVVAALMLFAFVACEPEWGRMDPPAGNQKISENLPVKVDDSQSFSNLSQESAELMPQLSIFSLNEV
jgi:hypothetical protein